MIKKALILIEELEFKKVDSGYYFKEILFDYDNGYLIRYSVYLREIYIEVSVDRIFFAPTNGMFPSIECEMFFDMITFMKSINKYFRNELRKLKISKIYDC